MKIEKGKCDCCGLKNAECMVLKKKVLLVFVTDVAICQTCVSAAFRSFKKGK